MTNRGSSGQKSLWHMFLLALILACTANYAWAQDDADDADDEEQITEEEEDRADLGRVEVTGSLLKRQDFTSTSPMQIINAETQFQAGQLSVADILQGSTVAAGTTQLNNQFNGFVIQGGTGVETLDLRGLGTTRTLTLLNGRRPGGSGTRGQVQALDLSSIPDIAVTRFEIVLDGSSSIYGSDAVAGVANIITRRSVDETEISVTADAPFDSGGEFYRLGFITGANFDSGSMTLSAQYTKQESLEVGDRDFLGCERDRVTDSSGRRIDREDRSAIAGTEGAGCYNMWFDSVIDALTGTRWITSPDGVFNGPIDGRRARANNDFDDDPLGQAWYETVRFGDFLLSETAINEQERINIYGTADFTFGNVEWDAEFLYSNRETTAVGWRQFFPLIGGAQAAALTGAPFFAYANDPTFNPVDPALSPVEGQLTQPIYPYPSNVSNDVDYFYATTGLSGMLPTARFWSWQVYGSYSRSDGDYASNAIVASRSGDVQFDPNSPTYDPYDPALLDGTDMARLVDIIGADTLGNTVYEQWQVTGIVTGDLFDLPAGTVGTALGLEYRDFSIDDQPDPLSQSGDLWGQSSARITKGDNNVAEIFAEVEIPLLAGVTGFESLTLNGSARYFDYDRGGSDSVWKAGLNWQVVPALRLRGTAGTSFRAPALFEQFLGDQTGFLPQTTIDPCVEWGDSSNENLRNNCAAEGIPPDYAGTGSSALIVSGGGVDNLESETSDAYTLGFVWSPQFANLNFAVDYFKIEVDDQIAQLGAGAIASGCYASENFPNAFCDLLQRNGADDPTGAFNITRVNDSFVNINSQTVEGIDFNLTWAQDFGWGRLDLEAQTTWQLENVFELFDPGLVSGFDELDVVGDIGTPEVVTNFRATARRNDWSVTYFLQFASETDAFRTDDAEINYFGEPNAIRDITFDAWFQHNISFLYQQDKWDFLLGINNIFDEDPDEVSAGAAGAVQTRGNIPISGTQASLLGRRIFGRVNFRF
ncbi:MAG: TonB-dependent receptor [Xanthomonadales bacterium]|nr:TonB-dependent receptor [Xanthomonadales bacterium]